MDLFAYTETAVDNSSLLVPIREWKAEGDGWVCRTKGWQVVVNGSELVETADASRSVKELLRMKPAVRYRTEINVEGRQSSEAFAIAFASAQKIAFKLCGVVYDPQQDILIVPLSEGPFSSMGKAPV